MHNLPELPKPFGSLNWTTSSEHALKTGYTEEQMREYALSAIALNSIASPPAAGERDYAMEHAEYLALDAERLIEAINEADRLRDECDQSVESIDVVESAYAARGDCMTGLQSAIYEFRKRRDRKATLTAAATDGGSNG